eukprot:8577639-Ditylum_brightwellii.AAC.1
MGKKEQKKCNQHTNIKSLYNRDITLDQSKHILHRLQCPNALRLHHSSMTGLAMHKAGLPLTVSRYFIKALEQLEYYMSTAHGLSDQTNQRIKENPVHGNSQ